MALRRAGVLRCGSPHPRRAESRRSAADVASRPCDGGVDRSGDCELDGGRPHGGGRRAARDEIARQPLDGGPTPFSSTATTPFPPPPLTPLPLPLPLTPPTS